MQFPSRRRCRLQPRPGADCVIRLSWQSGRCHTDARLHYRPVPGSVAFSARVNTSDGGTNKGKWQLLRTPGQGTAPNPSAVTADPPKPRCLMRVPRLRPEVSGAKVIIRGGKLCLRRRQRTGRTNFLSTLALANGRLSKRVGQGASVSLFID